MEQNSNCNTRAISGTARMWIDEGAEQDQKDMKALCQKLKPKPIKKVGWIVVWSDGGRTCIFDTWEEADARYQNYRETGEIIKVTWEEVE
jgi:hypothetical protein